MFLFRFLFKVISMSGHLTIKSIANIGILFQNVINPHMIVNSQKKPTNALLLSKNKLSHYCCFIPRFFFG